MIQGNYSFEDLVRVDCDLPPRAFFAGAVHEVAHFTLAKQTTFGLLCFFLSQDGDFGGQRLWQTLRLLEQASECTNECYARTMELLWGYQIADLSPEDRVAVIDEHRRQDYYCRYHMDQLEPILRNCKKESSSPVFPHQLFLLALNIDIRPFLEMDLSDQKQILGLLRNYPERFYPDHRFRLLTQTYQTLRRKLPPFLINAGLLCARCVFPAYRTRLTPFWRCFLKWRR